MLCLQVRKHEPIRIGDGIVVEVIAGLGTVKLGITAPPEIPIVRETAVDKMPRHTDAELDVMVGLVRGEPLHKLEERLDRSDFESDMITAPRARAMTRQIETLQRSIEYLRSENAELRAKLQDREHVG